jgi:hypothetical protein
VWRRHGFFSGDSNHQMRVLLRQTIVSNSYQNACISRALWKPGLEDACRGKSATRPRSRTAHCAPLALISNPTSVQKNTALRWRTGNAPSRTWLSVCKMRQLSVFVEASTDNVWARKCFLICFRSGTSLLPPAMLFRYVVPYFKAFSDVVLFVGS